MKKKTILAAVFISMSLIAFSQTELIYDDAPKNLMFDNILMNGDISEFVNKLTKQGFKSFVGSPYLVDLEGNLYGKECKLTVLGTEKTKNVYNITVYFTPNVNDWLSAKKEYISLKKIYQTKYGTGISIESFTKPNAEGDGREMDALKNYTCHYSTEWKSNQGKIYMTISYDGSTVISYTDKMNELKYKNEKSPDTEW